MAKTMTKYQLDHFRDKVKRHFNPLIEEQELLVKQYRTEATKKIVGRLAKKMGADKILTAFRNAEEQMKKAQQDAKTFFIKKAKTDDKKEKLNYNFTDREEKISLADCEEQLRDWAKDLVDREIRRRPEGKMLNQLENVKTKALDTVMESGSSETLIKALELCTKKIGITWVVDTSQIKQIASN
jgi:hypothetical protein|tara:strand:+ start:71 stop:622 length:552 start_codon:yes stop_codon:yes gene_type:complete